MTEADRAALQALLDKMEKIISDTIRDEKVLGPLPRETKAYVDGKIGVTKFWRDKLAALLRASSQGGQQVESKVSAGYPKKAGTEDEQVASGLMAPSTHSCHFSEQTLIDTWRERAIQAEKAATFFNADDEASQMRRLEAKILRACADELAAFRRQSPSRAEGEAPRNPERVNRLARSFAAEWLRPDDPGQATATLIPSWWR